MPAQIISGREISKTIITEITSQVHHLQEQGKQVPGLVTILVGSHPASVSYVALKSRVAREIGYLQIQEDLPETITEAELLAIIDRYNRHEQIHGILVQLPLPSHIDPQRINSAIHPEKDVDCFHPYNQGVFFSEYREDQLVACTPAGIMEMLRHTGIATSGKHAVVLGRSNLVGKPMLIMMLEKHFGGNAAVTAVHTGISDLGYYTRQADILIVAAGRPKLVTAEMVQEGAVVIDVGVNRVGERPGKNGNPVPLLCGDVDFEGVSQKAGYLTPVPGGVGPMTIAMLMKNTLTAFRQARRISSEGDPEHSPGLQG